MEGELVVSLVFVLSLISAAPSSLSESSTSTAAAPTPSSNRRGRSFPFFDYFQPETSLDYTSYESPQASDDYVGVGDESENELSMSSRTIGPSRNNYLQQQQQNRRRPVPMPVPVPVPTSSYNSPIYYIRLPPQPYMFVPGLGYVSQPAAAAVPGSINPFLNVPVSFVANGRPSTIYQWSGLHQQHVFQQDVQPSTSTSTTTTTRAPSTSRPADSIVHRLPGKYQFNGKPEDIYVLRDSYNSLYGDALQSFYP